MGRTPDSFYYVHSSSKSGIKTKRNIRVEYVVADYSDEEIDYFNEQKNEESSSDIESDFMNSNYVKTSVPTDFEIDFNDFEPNYADENEPLADLDPIAITESQKRLDRRRLTFEKSRANFLKQALKNRSLKNSICSVMGCDIAAEYRCSSCLNGHEMCSLHAEIDALEGCIPVDRFRRPFSSAADSSATKKLPRAILLFDIDGFIERPRKQLKVFLDMGYIPGTYNRPNFLFSDRLMRIASRLSRIAHMSFEMIFRCLVEEYLVPAPSKPVKQFGDALFEYMVRENDVESLLQMNSKTDCQMCFSDPNTTNNILLMADGNFALKHFKSCGVLNLPSLISESFFIPKKSYEEAENIESAPCSSFLAGSSSSNFNQQCDSTGIFGAICRHGFLYHAIEIERGEGLNYVTTIVDKFRRDFPTATLTLMYDISCKSRRYFEASGVKVPESMIVPAFHAPAHKSDCQVEYSPSTTLGYGLEDGEDMERNWSVLARSSGHLVSMRNSRRLDMISLYSQSIAKSKSTKIINFMKKDWKIAYEFIKLNITNDRESYIDLKLKLAAAKNQIFLKEKSVDLIEAEDPVSRMIKDADIIHKKLRCRVGTKQRVALIRRKCDLHERALHLARASNPETTISDLISKHLKSEVGLDERTLSQIAFWKNCEQLVILARDLGILIETLKQDLDRVCEIDFESFSTSFISTSASKNSPQIGSDELKIIFHQEIECKKLALESKLLSSLELLEHFNSEKDEIQDLNSILESIRLLF